MTPPIKPGKMFYVLAILVLLAQTAMPAHTAKAAPPAVATWCPAGVLPTETGCTNPDAINMVMDQIAKNPLSFIGAGTLYISSSYNIDDFTFDQTLVALTDLTVQGGWDGSTTSVSGNSTVSVPINFTWADNVTIKNITIVGVTGGRSAMAVTLTGNANLDVQYVESYSGTGEGASFNLNDSSGTITIQDSIFGKSGSRNGGTGLAIRAKTGKTLIERVTAEYNDIYGAYLDSDGSVEINNSTFSNNGDGGLNAVHITNALTLDTVHADNNSGGLGLFVYNAGSFSMTGGTINQNGDNGLTAVITGTDQNISLDGVTANGNTGIGAALMNAYAGGTSEIIVTNSTFGGEAGTGNAFGLGVNYKNKLTVTGGNASMNGVSGLNLYSATGAPALITGIQIQSNGDSGIMLSSPLALTVGDCGFLYYDNADADNAADLISTYSATWKTCPPKINQVNPTIGLRLGGTAVVITGENFTNATTAKFGGTSATCTYVSATTLNCSTPAHAVGLVDVVVTTVDESATLTGGFTYASDQRPSVSKIELLDHNPSLAGSVRYAVTFSEAVSGVDISDFKLVAVGVNDAAITKVEKLSGTPGSADALTAGANAYRVTVSTGTKAGTLRLDVRNNGSIKNLLGLSLLAPYSTGPKYTFDRDSWFVSQANYDGWMLEASEFRNKGGSFETDSSYLLVGDDRLNRQYRSLASFSTQTLPDNAVIQSVTLKIKLAGTQGGNPLLTHGPLVVDVLNVPLGDSVKMTADDFETTALKSAVAVLLPDPDQPGWYSLTLKKADFGLISKTGITEFRLRFKNDDDNDFVSDVVRFESGNNKTVVLRPSLFVSYIIP